MTLQQLISKLTYLSQKDGFDPDGEVLVNLYDKNGDNTKNLSIIDADWFWADIVDPEDTKKIAVIRTQMTD